MLYIYKNKCFIIYLFILCGNCKFVWGRDMIIMMYDYVISKKGCVLWEFRDLVYSFLFVVVFICKIINIVG